MERQMKIYTKTGDKGTTFNGKDRVPKHDPSIDVQGELDETNAWIGMIRKSLLGSSYDYATSRNSEMQSILQSIQENMFNIGGQLATGKPMLKREDVLILEDKIDEMNKSLPELKNFIYPIESPTVHVARAVCRRAERKISSLIESEQSSDTLMCTTSSEENSKYQLIVPYLNRLSDFLFVLARKLSESDATWVTDRNDH
jgi:cob(I)alamin adenosyltransferase